METFKAKIVTTVISNQDKLIPNKKCLGVAEVVEIRWDKEVIIKVITCIDKEWAKTKLIIYMLTIIVTGITIHNRWTIQINISSQILVKLISLILLTTFHIVYLGLHNNFNHSNKCNQINNWATNKFLKISITYMFCLSILIWCSLFHKWIYLSKMNITELWVIIIIKMPFRLSRNHFNCKVSLRNNL